MAPRNPQSPTTSLLFGGHQLSQTTGHLFSGMLGLNIVLLGAAFICSKIFNSKAVTLRDVEILLATLKVLSLLWFLCYISGAMSQPQSLQCQDPHAGSIWVRGSLVLFGCFTVCLNIFRMGYAISHFRCKEKLEFIFPFIESIFVVIQTWVLWKHAKDCAQVQTNFTRCGLMLTLATNLLLWFLAVTNDSLHLEIEAALTNEAVSETGGGGGGATAAGAALYEGVLNSHTVPNNHLYHGNSSTNSSKCQCSGISLCEVFQKGYLILYPFSTEYCLISCTVLFVMWKNVGRSLQSHSSIPRHEVPFRLHGAIFGPLLGLVAMVAGVCVFILFQIQASGRPIAPWSFTLYYAFYVAILLAMIVACLVGMIIHELEERELDLVENPTRSLDVVVLTCTALGRMGIAYFSLVAIVASHSHELFSHLLLSYSLLIVMQLVTQNLFIVGDLHRQPLWEMATGNQAAGKQTSEDKSEQNHGVTLKNLRQSLQPFSLAYIHSYSNLSWKRRGLKEISLFLIFCNMTLWVMPAFGIHPEFKNGLEKDFYGYHTWFTVVNFGLPLGVFYRMHSVGALMEVYLGA